MNFMEMRRSRCSPTPEQELKEVCRVDTPIPILVVSSEFKNGHALKDILSREGREVICASTTGECEEVFAPTGTFMSSFVTEV
jgi:hypothetical protein